MTRSILVTRPRFDRTTKYIAEWAKKVIAFAKDKGVKVIDLADHRANRVEFEGTVQKTNPDFIFFNGHGNESSIMGHDNEVLASVGTSGDFVCKRIIYALSCSTGKTFGPWCIKARTLAFIGYKEDFGFYYMDEKRTRPFEDKLAALFLEPSNQVAVSLLKGHTAGEAYNASQNSFRHSIRKLLSTVSTQSESVALPLLVWDMQHQVCLGDSEARL
jgi:hypothetical protein